MDLIVMVFLCCSLSIFLRILIFLDLYVFSLEIFFFFIDNSCDMCIGILFFFKEKF